ncbi:uncharacterized protein A4U43_C07F17930 [Asparagus officinalis]|uniref:Uncharacterized protein n=1 Tax=Asparagus officinalis TaxID=4686 RepID=A0A5P1ECT3_ASPOF|nr:uncharacterized protein A4U43_C07F17930 [Asparagus officinalis]
MADKNGFSGGGRSLDRMAAYRNPRNDIMPSITKTSPQHPSLLEVCVILDSLRTEILAHEYYPSARCRNLSGIQATVYGVTSKKFARGVRRVVVATVGFGLEGFLVVGEVEGAVDVLDDDDGFGGGGDEELAEVGVGVDDSEFEGVEVEVEEVDEV